MLSENELDQLSVQMMLWERSRGESDLSAVV